MITKEQALELFTTGGHVFEWSPSNGPWKMRVVGVMEKHVVVATGSGNRERTFDSVCITEDECIEAFFDNGDCVINKEDLESLLVKLDPSYIAGVHDRRKVLSDCVEFFDQFVRAKLTILSPTYKPTVTVIDPNRELELGDHVLIHGHDHVIVDIVGWRAVDVEKGGWWDVDGETFETHAIYKDTGAKVVSYPEASVYCKALEVACPMCDAGTTITADESSPYTCKCCDAKFVISNESIELLK